MISLFARLLTMRSPTHQRLRRQMQCKSRGNWRGQTGRRIGPLWGRRKEFPTVGGGGDLFVVVTKKSTRANMYLHMRSITIRSLLPLRAPSPPRARDHKNWMNEWMAKNEWFENVPTKVPIFGRLTPPFFIGAALAMRSISLCSHVHAQSSIFRLELP